MNTLLNYPGAKWGMAEQIVSLMPHHRSYLEPFFGSGAVLFNKPPSAIETVNDIDGDVVNFFKVLRERPEELAEAISLTPYARDVFDDAHENRGTDSFDRAYRFAIRMRCCTGMHRAWWIVSGASSRESGSGPPWCHISLENIGGNEKVPEKFETVPGIFPGKD